MDESVLLAPTIWYTDTALYSALLLGEDHLLQVALYTETIYRLEIGELSYNE